MLILRCTARLLTRMRVQPARVVPTDHSAPRLGDWYANVLQHRRTSIALFVNAPTRLAVVVPAAPIATVVPRFQDALGAVLRALEVPGDAVAAELRAMEEVVVARTASRHVLGSMKELALALKLRLDDPPPLPESWHTLSMWLAGMILTIDGEFAWPNERTRALWGMATDVVAWRAPRRAPEEGG